MKVVEIQLMYTHQSVPNEQPVSDFRIVERPAKMIFF